MFNVQICTTVQKFFLFVFLRNYYYIYIFLINALHQKRCIKLIKLKSGVMAAKNSALHHKNNLHFRIFIKIEMVT